MAEPARKQTTAEAFLEPFREKYDTALELCKAAADTTATEGWQANYEAQVHANRQRVQESIAQINSATSAYLTNGASEEGEKAMKDAVKALADERTAYLAWRFRQVEQYARPVRECKAIAEQAVSMARQEASANPLTARGLVEAVTKEVQTWTIPTWNEQNGTVCFP